MVMMVFILVKNFLRNVAVVFCRFLLWIAVMDYDRNSLTVEL